MPALVLFSTLMQATTPPAIPIPDNNFAQASDPANVIESVYAPRGWERMADSAAAEWTGISGREATRGFFGQSVPLPPTEIRSRGRRKTSTSCSHALIGPEPQARPCCYRQDQPATELRRWRSIYRIGLSKDLPVQRISGLAAG